MMRPTRAALAGLAALALANAAWAEGAACTDWGTRGALVFQDDFTHGLDRYVAEYARKPGNTVEAKDGRLLLDVDGGATVWLNQPLSGNVLIAFTRRVVVDGGRNDRLSDFNMFWMARDPKNANLFTRSGKFEDYDDLTLYYVGIGGNTNKTTRLRRYDAGKRELVGELLDAPHLLQANHDYQVEIAVKDGCTRVVMDGQQYFAWRDPQPLTQGYFGFRTTWSRQTIANLKIYQLK
jgi:hypothetical protein